MRDGKSTQLNGAEVLKLKEVEIKHDHNTLYNSALFRPLMTTQSVELVMKL